jgi:hypothetical protein
MNRKQLVSAWIYALIWGFFMFVLGLNGSDALPVIEMTVFWGVFAALTHVTLKSRK